MAEYVVVFLVQQLSTLLDQECSHLGGFRRELQYIKDELASMRAFLREAEAKEDSHDPDSEHQEWINQVHEVVFDTEDVIDDFVHRFGHHRGGGFYGHIQKIYNSIKTLKARHRISIQIKDIKYRVESISARHQRYKSENNAAERGSSNIVVGEDAEYDIRRHALLLEEADLVVIDKPKHELISHILDDESHLKVISVVGMGGSGKTTLTKRVYEDATVKRKIFTHAWVTVSQTLHLKDLFKNLVQQFYKEIQEQLPQMVESMDSDSLRAFVKEFLKGKMFIIVLDDVWSIESWDAIKYALPNGNCGSRVLLTTRIADVAAISSKESRGHIYKMKPLSVEGSWNLFCRKTFEDNCCPQHLEQVSRDILSKCDGLPLAIVAVGGFLALKDTSSLDEWEMVRCSLRGVLEGTRKLDRVKKILLLSYQDLPYYLKICLLYMCIYPEDCKILVHQLTRLWIAEGFVQEINGMTSVEVALGYFNELVNRSLVQAEESFDGLWTHCSVHDLLREVILSKSKGHKLATVAAGRYTKWPDNARRLVIRDFIDNAPKGFDFKYLRSLAITGYTNPTSSSCLSKLLCGCPKLLKVLELVRAGLTRIPEEVFKFVHLKHLNLKDNPIKVIPRSIGKLHNLEFLNLSVTDVEELPVDILKLGKLRELYAYQLGGYSENYAFHGFKASYEIGQLVSLQYLDCIDTENVVVVREIGKLTQLRRLSITNLRSKDGKELCFILEKLTNLRVLGIHLVNDDEILDLQHPMSRTPGFLQRLYLTGPLEKLPRWVRSLQSLKLLYLRKSRLMKDTLESLRDLPNLLVLFLYEAYEGDTLCFADRGFRKLKELHLHRLEGLRRVVVEKGTMPNLNLLRLTNCKLMEEPPQGIQNLTKLQTLRLDYMSTGLIMKLQNKESEAYRNIAHIPEVTIGNCVGGKWEAYYL